MATTKRDSILNTRGANIDAHYGPWDSIAQYEEWNLSTGRTDVIDAVTICIKNTDGTHVKYIREKGEWRKEGLADIPFQAEQGGSGEQGSQGGGDIVRDFKGDIVIRSLSIDEGKLSRKMQARLLDREYDEENPDGLGYVVLENDLPLSQQVVNANTIYEIRNVHTIEGDFAIPQGCELRFNGGKIVGGNLSGRVINESINVVDLGAESDFSTALQNAINLGITKILIPRKPDGGMWHMTNGVTIDHPVEIVGDNATIGTEERYIGSLVSINSAKNVSISGIKMRNGYPNMVDGKIVLTSLSVMDDTGCVIVSDSEDVRISGCAILSNGERYGIKIKTSKGVIVENCDFDSAAWHNVYAGEESEDVEVRGCKFKWNTSYVPSDSNHSYLFATGVTDRVDLPRFLCRNINVHDNEFYDNIFWEGVDSHGVDTMSVTNNTIKNCKIGVMIAEDARFNGAFKCTGITISGNTIDRGTCEGEGRGIIHRGYYHFSDSAEISGNTVIGFGRVESSEGLQSADCAVYLAYTRNAKITGNNIIDSDGKCLMLYSNNVGTIVTGNTFSTSNYAQSNSAIHVSSGNCKYEIRGNNIRTDRAFAVLIASNAHNVGLCSNNTISGNYETAVSYRTNNILSISSVIARKEPSSSSFPLLSDDEKEIAVSRSKNIRSKSESYDTSKFSQAQDGTIEWSSRNAMTVISDTEELTCVTASGETIDAIAVYDKVSTFELRKADGTKLTERIVTISTKDASYEYGQSFVDNSGDEYKWNGSSFKPVVEERNIFIVYHNSSSNSRLQYVVPSAWEAIEKTGQVAAGVAFIQGDKTIIVAKNGASVLWSEEVVIAGGTIAKTAEESAADFNGEFNADIQYANEKCNSPEVAVGYCKNYSALNSKGVGFPAGTWRLPSMGELMAIVGNIRIINYALSFISGSSSITAYLWSSTERDINDAWCYNIVANIPLYAPKCGAGATKRWARPVIVFNSSRKKQSVGTTRPALTSNDIGYVFFDSNVGKPIWWDGDKWIDAAGNNV